MGSARAVSISAVRDAGLKEFVQESKGEGLGDKVAPGILLSLFSLCDDNFLLISTYAQETCVLALLDACECRRGVLYASLEPDKAGRLRTRDRCLRRRGLWQT